MSRRIWEPETLAAIASVEGPKWIQEQNTALAQFEAYKYSLEHSYVGALMSWTRGRFLANSGMSEAEIYGEAGVIYGFGGWHRYPVREDGRVVFSAYHTPTKKPDDPACDRARAAGFDVE